jgi:hypothetical protein
MWRRSARIRSASADLLRHYKASNFIGIESQGGSICFDIALAHHTPCGLTCFRVLVYFFCDWAKTQDEGRETSGGSDAR